MESLIQDLRYAVRSLKKRPGFTAIAIAALALGVGANTTIFGLVSAVFLRPLPFPEPDELVVVWERNTAQGKERERVAAPNYVDWREGSRTIEDLAAWMHWSYTLTGLGEPLQVTAPRVSPSLFAVLGVEPALGHTFTEQHERPGNHRVAVLSYGFWQSRFAGDSSVVGRALMLEGEPYTMLGVMPAGFRFPDSDAIRMWVPLAFTEVEIASRRRRSFNVLGRLADGVELAQAEAELRGIAAGIAEASPETNQGWSVTAVRASDVVIESSRYLVMLLGAVGFVLLIACATVANLLLSRVADREREIAIRAALGAGRFRVMTQLLLESAVLAALGGALGLGLAVWGIDGVLALHPGGLPGWNDVRIDPMVLGFTFGISLATACLAGLVPSIQASRSVLSEALKDGMGRSTGGRRRARMRSTMVVAQVAIALVLLVGAGLLINSFVRLRNTSPGFRTEQLLAVNLFLSEQRYAQDERQIAFFTDLIEGLQAMPEVLGAGAASALPLNQVGGADFDLPIVVEGREQPAPGQEPEVDFRVVTDDYLQVMGVPLLRGRAFDARDRDDRARVMIVNETMARLYFPEVDPIGRRVSVPWGGWREVIGVVGDVRDRGLDAVPRPEMYVPLRQEPFSAMVVVVRAAGDPLTVIEQVKRHVYAIDPEQPVHSIASMDELIADSVADRRFSLTLLGMFASLATLLAAIGIYGVVSYGVATRTREIGVRVALGAVHRDIMRLVLRQGFAMAAAGVGIGAVAALLLTRVLSSLLYEVSATDPWTFAVVSLALLAVALLATYVPARRAMRVDPIAALREE